MLYKQLPWERFHTRDWHERPGRSHFASSNQGLACFQLGSALGQGPFPLLVLSPTHKPRLLRQITRDLMTSSPEPPTRGQVVFGRRRGSRRGKGQVGFYLPFLLLRRIPSPVSDAASCNPIPAPAPRGPPSPPSCRAQQRHSLAPRVPHHCTLPRIHAHHAYKDSAPADRAGHAGCCNAP